MAVILIIIAIIIIAIIAGVESSKKKEMQHLIALQMEFAWVKCPLCGSATRCHDYNIGSQPNLMRFCCLECSWQERTERYVIPSYLRK